MLDIKAISDRDNKGPQAGAGKIPDKRDVAAPPPPSGPQIFSPSLHLHIHHRLSWNRPCQLIPLAPIHHHPTRLCVMRSEQRPREPSRAHRASHEAYPMPCPGSGHQQIKEEIPEA